MGAACAGAWWYPPCWPACCAAAGSARRRARVGLQRAISLCMGDPYPRPAPGPYDYDHMDADLLRALPPGRDRSLARGEVLFRSGDAALGLVLVREGMLELVRISPEGRRLVLHRAGTGMHLRRGQPVREPSPLRRHRRRAGARHDPPGRQPEARGRGRPGHRLAHRGASRSTPRSPSGLGPSALPCRMPPTGCSMCCTHSRPSPMAPVASGGPGRRSQLNWGSRTKPHTGHLPGWNAPACCGARAATACGSQRPLRREGRLQGVSGRFSIIMNRAQSVMLSRSPK
jgi:hypothetical protein